MTLDIDSTSIGEKNSWKDSSESLAYESMNIIRFSIAAG